MNKLVKEQIKVTITINKCIYKSRTHETKLYSNYKHVFTGTEPDILLPSQHSGSHSVDLF